jgi:hypothetical protein
MAEQFVTQALQHIVRTAEEEALATLFDNTHPISNLKSALGEIIKSGTNPFPERGQKSSKQSSLSNGKVLILTYLGSGQFGNVFKVRTDTSSGSNCGCSVN